MKNTQEIDDIVARMEQRLSIAKKRCENLPTSQFSYEDRKSYSFIFEEYRENGKRKRRSLNKEPEYAAELVRRELLEAEIESLEKDIKLLKGVEARLSGYDIDAEVVRIRQRVPILTDEIVRMALADPEKDEWASAEYEKSTYKPEFLRHFTTRGLKVRSKSEVIIAEQLYAYGIAFRFEQVLHIGNNSFAPDFTIRRADGKIIYWEHEGLMGSEGYRNRQDYKGKIYTMANIVPWDNLIVTYDDVNGNIDLRIVKSEIENKLLV